MIFSSRLRWTKSFGTEASSVTRPFGSYPGWVPSNKLCWTKSLYYFSYLVTQFLLFVHLGNSLWICVSMLSLNLCPNLDKENASAKQQWDNPRGALDQKNIPNNIKNWSQCSNCSLLLRYFWQTKHFKNLSFYRREFLMTHILIQLQLENFHYCHIIVSAIIERKSWTYLGFIQSSESF